MTPSPRSTTSRRERPAKPALTRAGIVSAALKVTRTEGLERLTMRRVAQELDTGAASLYVYVRNTAELYAAVLDELIGTVDLTAASATGDWRARLHEVLTSYIYVLFEYPSLAHSALVSHPCGPHYLSLIEALLTLLRTGDVPDDRAAWGVDVLMQFATASAAEHSTRAGTVDAEEEDDALATALREASGENYPHIAALGEDLLSGPGADRLTWGIDVLISGVLHTPRPKPKP